MNYYLAKMIFRIISGEGQQNAQFDEQLRLVCAGSKEEALIKARNFGEKGQDSFYNTRQQLVQWQFIDVCELYSLQELSDGAEICSRVEEVSNAEQYISFIRNKAGEIIQQIKEPAQL